MSDGLQIATAFVIVASGIVLAAQYLQGRRDSRALWMVVVLVMGTAALVGTSHLAPQLAQPVQQPAVLLPGSEARWQQVVAELAGQVDSLKSQLRDLDVKYQTVIDLTQSQPKVQVIEPNTMGKWVILIVFVLALFLGSLLVASLVRLLWGRKGLSKRALQSATIITVAGTILGSVSLFHGTKIFGSLFEHLFENLFKVTLNEVAAIPPLEITVDVVASEVPVPPPPPQKTRGPVDCGNAASGFKPIYEFEEDGRFDDGDIEANRIRNIGETFVRGHPGELLDVILIVGSANKKRIANGNDQLVKKRIHHARNYVINDKLTWTSEFGDISNRIIMLDSTAGSALRIRAGTENQASIAFDAVRAVMICTVWSKPKSGNELAVVRPPATER